MSEIRVLVVDDSSSMRRLVRQALDQDSRITVVGEAADAYEARTAIKALSPNVLTLDVEMPGMNGLEFLEKIMRLRPMPVVMLSSVTKRGSKAAMDALALGAVDCIAKPEAGATGRVFGQLADSIVVAARANLRGRSAARPQPATGFHWNNRIVMIGASTGGLDAIETVLSGFPANAPPTLITQHMPAGFLVSFAQRLNQRVAPRVKLAQDGEPLKQGHVYIAPGGEHHVGLAAPDGQRLRVFSAAPDLLHIPCVDEMFQTGTTHARRIVAVLLTGMGRDGADGMVALRQAGADTIGQDRQSCVVYGMPRAAAEAGAVGTQLPVGRIAEKILSLTGRSVARSAV